MERTFTNQQGEKPCFICGEVVANGEESTWDRSPKKQGKCHLTCLASRNLAERNGKALDTSATSVATVDGNVHANGNGNGKSGGGWLDGLAEQLAPYLESRIAQKLDRDEVADMLKTMLDGAVMLKATTVIVENKTTGVSHNLGLQHERFTDLLALVQAGVNVWLSGPAGSAKTTAVENVSKALSRNYYHVGALDNEYKLFGFMDAHGKVVRTSFRDWWENGGVMCFDEIDSWLPSATLALNGALANGHCTFPDSTVPVARHADCIAVACANTWGLGQSTDYVGRMKQDAAFLDRFCQLDWPYDESFELAISGNPEWAKRVQGLRRKAKAKGLKVIISPRASIYGARLLASGVKQSLVEQVTLRKGMTQEQWESIQ